MCLRHRIKRRRISNLHYNSPRARDFRSLRPGKLHLSFIANFQLTYKQPPFQRRLNHNSRPEYFRRGVVVASRKLGEFLIN